MQYDNSDHVIEEFFPTGGYVVGFCDQYEEEEELDLNRLAEEAHAYFSANCPSEEQLRKERRASVYERESELEAGPWLHTVRVFGWEERETPFGTAKFRTLVDEYDVGYEGNAETLEMIPERWEAEFEGHTEMQRCIETLERKVSQAVVHDTIEWTADDRFEFYCRVAAWVRRSPASVVAQHSRQFWERLNSSRKLCDKRGLWSYVVLTKAQADSLNTLIRSKCGWHW